MGRLTFDQPLRRYDLTSVTMLFNASPRYQPYVAGPGNQLRFNPAGMIGEFRGWTSDGGRRSASSPTSPTASTLGPPRWPPAGHGR
jgi:hypothetical protein